MIMPEQMTGSSGKPDKPKLVCLTPVRNEAWILDVFLACTSMWADHIIIVDQCSDDGSREIARAHPKVTLIENDSPEYNEKLRQKMLIEAARAIEGPKVLVALDADEFFVADFIGGDEWNGMLSAEPGTVFTMQWACVRPDKESYYVFDAEFPLVYVDDGYEHQGTEIHSPRLPLPPHTPRIPLGVKTLHLAMVDRARFDSKIRWYQCWEMLTGKWDRRSFELYRFYHTEYAIAPSRLMPLPSSWIDGYGNANPMGYRSEPYYRWDGEMLDLLIGHGPSRFRQADVWGVDWNGMHKAIRGSEPPVPLDDPRSFVEKRIHRWLEETQWITAKDAPRRDPISRRRHRMARWMVKKLGW